MLKGFLLYITLCNGERSSYYGIRICDSKAQSQALVSAPYRRASAVGYCLHSSPSTVAGDLQAILVSNPKVAAAVAEICMVGLATTAQATKGPPKPDKARIDRLAYVVSESLSLLLMHSESC